VPPPRLLGYLFQVAVYNPESMTFGAMTIMAEQRLVRVQEKGQVTLPAEIRRKLGLKKGDLVAVTETDDGLLITPQQALANRALDRIGAVLREQGLTLEDLIESGREIRGSTIKEKYGLDETARQDLRRQ
jgi:AbrB family looped-hinge helix DNA binding protein